MGCPAPGFSVSLHIVMCMRTLLIMMERLEIACSSACSPNKVACMGITSLRSSICGACKV